LVDDFSALAQQIMQDRVDAVDLGAEIGQSLLIGIDGNILERHGNPLKSAVAA
jgi:hypothetical protein